MSIGMRTRHRTRSSPIAVGFVLASTVAAASAFSLVSPFGHTASRSCSVSRLSGLTNRQVRGHGPRIQVRNPCMSLEFDGTKESGGRHQLIQDFLTQRSIQTLMHSMKLVGDMSNLEFLESFMDHQGLSNFHGYGGLRTDSATYIKALQRSVPIVVVKRKKFYRGGSPNNPYVTDNEFSFSSTIVPRTLASSIISMREVLAKEFVEDLELIAAENAELWRHHEEVVRNREDRGLQLLHPAREDCDENSPLRLATFDLLEKLATDIAVQRVADELLRGPSSGRHAGRWLHEQYILFGAGFRGDHGEDVGRKFMLHLLNAMPVIVASANGPPAFVDPLDVAQRVMEERELAAERWAEGLAETASHHARWTAQLLESCLVREAPEAFSGADFRPRPPPSSPPKQVRKSYRIYLFLFPAVTDGSAPFSGPTTRRK